MNNPSHVSPATGEIAKKISHLFSIYDIQEVDGNIYFFGVPKEDIRTIYHKLWAILLQNGYQFSYRRDLGEDVLIASPIKPANERRWINVVLALATFVTTMVMGSILFGADPLSNPLEAIRGIPFTLAIMTVLGAHEAGHYLVARKHGMNTSLPYFIPVPFPPTGTMGAVIKHRGPIPNRKALFDVGASGPLVGLCVSIIVTVIGLLQPPLTQVSGDFVIQLGLPPLFEFITRFIPTGETTVMHPIAFAGWVGMLITALNLIPAGQLDGGHILRAMIGEKASRVSWALAFGLLFLGFYMTFIMNINGSMWLFWGFLLVLFAASGHPRPLDDEVPLGRERMVLGVITFALALLSVTLIPFQVQ